MVSVNSDQEITTKKGKKKEIRGVSAVTRVWGTRGADGYRDYRPSNTLNSLANLAWQNGLAQNTLRLCERFSLETVYLD